MHWLAAALVCGVLGFGTGRPFWYGASALGFLLYALYGAEAAGGRRPGVGEGASQPEAEGGAGAGEPLTLPIEDSIDLHAFAPAEVTAAAADYLEAAAAAGFREVRLIHGRGIGFQREQIRKMLRGHPSVERFWDAPPERGGWGATVVMLIVEPPRSLSE